jgi:hypothetical protein
MHRIYSSVLILIVVAFLCSTMNGRTYAGAGTCSTTGATEYDTECGYLYLEELQEDDRTTPPRTGIDLFLGDDVYFDEVVEIGFDATEVGTRTWNDGLTDFTWTFNGSGGTGLDPTMTFGPYMTTHTGAFVVDTSFATIGDNFASDISLVVKGTEPFVIPLFY